MKKFIRKSLLKISGRDDFKYFKSFSENYMAPKDELDNQQLIALIELVSYAKKNIPYYQNILRDFSVEELKSLSDLQKIPIVTKSIINKDPTAFIPERFTHGVLQGSTGGSTGRPLKYKMSKSGYSRGRGLMYRGWSHAGYELGDSMAIVAGASLIKGRSSIKANLKNKLFNRTPFSSFGLSKEKLNVIFRAIKNDRPKFIRGYSSALFMFCNHMKQFQLQLGYRPGGIFSTAEMLFDHQRELIQEVLGCKVYNQYGLNDGGVSAYEDFITEGMSVDTERGILEVVDESGKQVYNQPGRVLATALYNYDFIFLRYDTNDLATMQIWNHQGIRRRDRLTELLGRATDSLTVNGLTIGTPVLTVLMGKTDVEQYQIIQERDNRITLIIKPLPGFDNHQRQFIRDSFFSHLGKFDLAIDTEIPFVKSENKHKFIIKNLDN